MQVQLYGFHGRGVPTACRAITKACALSSMPVQALVLKNGYKTAFIKFGKELAGKQFDEPDYIIFLDKIELKGIQLKEKSVAIYNSKERVENAIFKKKKIKSHFVDAFSVSLKPNMVMLGAFAKICGKVSATSLRTVIKAYGSSALSEFESGYQKVK